MSLPTNEFNDVNPHRRKMSDFDQEYLIRLINKHNFHFQKMAFDITTNHFQLTEQRLRKMFEKYIALPINQRISLSITSPAALSAIDSSSSTSIVSSS